MKNYAFKYIAFAFAALCPAMVHAEIITWGSAQNTTGATDVRTNGTLFAAFNAGPDDGSSVNVNGVEFVNASPFQFGAGSFLGGGDTGDVGLNRLLNQNSFNFNNPNPGNGLIDLGVFDVGTTYEIQVFFTDQRSNSNDRTVFYGSTDGVNNGSEVGLLGDPNQNVSAPFGQFAIGTFVGDGFDPDLVVRADGITHTSAQITAWQVRAVSAVPEPSSLIYFGTIGIVGLIRRRKKK